MQNEIKGIVARMLAQRGVIQYGIVSAVDPSSHAVKVRKQPGNVETTWMPVGSLGCGSIRISRMPDMNEHVLITPTEDNPEMSVVISSVFDTQVMPPVSPLTGTVAQSGEFFIQTGCDIPPAIGQNQAVPAQAPSYSTPWLHITKNKISLGAGDTRLTLDASGVYVTGSVIDTTGVLRTSVGATTTFSDGDGNIVNVSDGIITGVSS